MTRWSRSAVLVPALTLVLVAGCLTLSDDELAPFGTVQGPAWQAGFTWTWAANVQGGASYTGPDGTHESLGRSNATVTHRVDGTAPLAAGGEGVVVQRDGQLYSPYLGALFGDDSLLLFETASLEPLARAYTFDGCEDPLRVRWHEAGSAGPAPLVAFPVTQGDTWSGRDGQIAWKAQVLGEESVAVPAGSFEAIVVHVTAWLADDPPAPAPAGPMMYEYAYHQEFEAFELSMKTWYAPEVQHIVRVDSRLTSKAIHGGDTEERTDVSSTLTLTSFDLEPADSTGYAKYRGNDPYRHMPPVVHVTTTTPLPMNARDGTEVTLGLADGHGDKGIVTVDELGTYVVPEAYEGFHISWTVRDPDRRTITHGEGPVFTFDVPPGGVFDVRVRLSDGAAPVPVSAPVAMAADGEMIMAEGMVMSVSPSMCGGWSSMTVAAERLHVGWADTYAADVPAGAAVRVELGTFEAPPYPGTATADVRVQSDVPYVNDDHALVLVAPDGTEMALEGSAQIDQPGTWTVVWDANGLLGNILPTSVNIGHQVEVDLDVVY